MKKLLVILCAALALLLSACQGGGQPETIDPAAEKFVGCWENYDSYDWICIYEDGTYELVNNDGEHYGRFPYEMDGDALNLTDCGVTVEMDNSGNLLASTGEQFFRSTLPDANSPSEESGSMEDELLHRTQVAEQFAGTWKSPELGGWLIIEPYVEGVYYTYNTLGMEMGMGGDPYEIKGEELYLAAHDVTLSLDENGNILTSDGYLLERSEIIVAEDQNELLQGEWIHTDGEWSLTFDGEGGFGMTGPGTVFSGTYRYDTDGIHIYNFGAEVDSGDLEPDGGIVLYSMEGKFYPPEEQNDLFRITQGTWWPTAEWDGLVTVARMEMDGNGNFEAYLADGTLKTEGTLDAVEVEGTVRFDMYDETGSYVDGFYILENGQLVMTEGAAASYEQ